MDNENLGAVVAALRGEMSQGELAQKMTERGHDWQQVTVSRLERGIRALKLFEAVDLAAVLGVSLDELMDTANNRAGSAQDRARLAKARNDLRTAHTSAVLALVEVLEANAVLTGIRREVEQSNDSELAQQAFASALEQGDYSIWQALTTAAVKAGDRGLIEGVSSDSLATPEGRGKLKEVIKNVMGVQLHERPLT